MHISQSLPLSDEFGCKREDLPGNETISPTVGDSSHPLTLFMGPKSFSHLVPGARKRRGVVGTDEGSERITRYGSRKKMIPTAQSLFWVKQTQDGVYPDV